MGLLNGDVILDQEAFDTASKDFAKLVNTLADLRLEIETIIESLKTGFNTPAGRKFIKSCEANLFQPLKEQEAVIKLMSNTLDDVKKEYSLVFDEYEKLINIINSVAQ